MNTTEADVAGIIERAVALGLRGIAYAKLRTISRRMHRIFERQCNGYANAHQEALDDRALERLVSVARAIATQNGLHAYIQRDPRGASLYLSRHPVDHSSYSSRGIAIY